MTNHEDREYGALIQRVDDLEEDMRQVVKDQKELRAFMLKLVLIVAGVVGPVVAALASRLFNGVGP